ncbi:hypothetical protein [Streptococcus dysgalactiae]|uniref:hypothetical protein n=1 Tax=Streptococcus dysgalactiae TaxID=1334 RepID=UPI0012A83A94|nr:hypothetical protein [Streptococcus dysgalactiae]QGH04676.1 hypothetical protein EA458_09590 [Streptococcus dysgalactiae subsp. dysgalactiae]
MENGIIYDDFFNNSVINQFGLELLWSDHYQQYIKNNRYFFFYNWRVRFEKKGNTLISFENGKVVIREFFNQNIYKEYEYDFVNSQEKNLIDSYLKSFDETKKLIEVYYKDESALPEYYDIWKLYRAYEYNFETIKKCRYNKDFELNVDISKFSKKSEGKTLQFKKLKNQVIKSFV